jgi:hypothetical protein
MTDGERLTAILAQYAIPCDKFSFHGKLDALAAGLGIQTQGRLLGDVLDDIAAKMGVERDNRLYGTFIRKLYEDVTSGEDTTLSGNTLLLENCIGGRTLKALHIYGKSTQDGTPSPDNPVPIVSAGDGGSITLKVTGKNLHHATQIGEFYSAGINMTIKASTIALKGTATEDILFTRWLVEKDKPLLLDPNKRYTISPRNIGVMVYAYDEEGIGTYNGSKIPERSTGAGVYYQRNLKKDETVDLKISIQVELGTEATEYEPYREQLLVLQTPNALPGIPVSSSGNYTDENGQQWVCDEVDLARGVYVRRVTKIKLTSSMRWTKAGNKVDRYFYTFDGINTVGVLCTHFSAAINGETVGGIATSSSNIIGFAYAERGTTTVDDFKAFLDANEVYVYVPLATPVETALSSAEIAAYKALTTYAPTTVISANGVSGLKATYRHTKTAKDT